MTSPRSIGFALAVLLACGCARSETATTVLSSRDPALKTARAPAQSEAACPADAAALANDLLGAMADGWYGRIPNNPCLIASAHPLIAVPTGERASPQEGSRRPPLRARSAAPFQILKVERDGLNGYRVTFRWAAENGRLSDAQTLAFVAAASRTARSSCAILRGGPAMVAVRAACWPKSSQTK